MKAHRNRIRGATVVITGASSGIGQATAEAFARQGARLVLVARDGDATEAVARDCRDLDAEALAVAADITDAMAVAEVAQQAADFGGGIDIWVSNVGTGAAGAFHEVPIEAHEQAVRTNLIGHMNDAHAVLPVFLRQRRGVFINMISLGGFADAPHAAAYSAGKFGLRGLAEALRGELMHEPGIHICDIYPSFVDTPGFAHGANHTGRELSAPPPRPTTMLGAPTALIRLAHAVAPELTTRAVALFLESCFRRAPRTAIDGGTLFRPPAGPGGIDGGLRSPAQRSAVAGAALGLAALGVVAVALRGRRR